MKFMTALCCAISISAAAVETAKTTAIPTNLPANTMGHSNWMPHQVTKADKKGIEALYTQFHAAMAKGDFDTAIGFMDFPMYMLTDNSQGVVSSGLWTKEQFTEKMKPMFTGMTKETMPKTNFIPYFMSNNFAFVQETNTLTMNKKPATWNSGSMAILKDGKWYFKGMMEGGWGDSMGNNVAANPAGMNAPGTKTAATGTAMPNNTNNTNNTKK